MRMKGRLEIAVLIDNTGNVVFSDLLEGANFENME